MRLLFRHRILLGFVILGTLPLAVALLVLVSQVRANRSGVGPRAALDEIAESGRAAVAAIDTTQLDPEARTALRNHVETIVQQTSLARRAETLTRVAAGTLAATILVLALVVIAGSVLLARRWSAYLSAPVDELIDWVHRIRNRDPLPAAPSTPAPPEFDSLHRAMHHMAGTLDEARRAELERERLAAFRETARRVAHEIRGPLTSARLAVSTLAQHDEPIGTSRDAIDVLGEEIQRLDQMAREFAEFGRLPEGPRSVIQLRDLLVNVIAAIASADVPVRLSADQPLEVSGHYEPLRRALFNVIYNAVEAADARGVQVTLVQVDLSTGPTARIRVSDHGTGIAPEHRDRVFEPYFTTKNSGTGLGLAMVHLTVTTHDGRIAVEDTPGGGATFVIDIPLRS